MTYSFSDIDGPSVNVNIVFSTMDFVYLSLAIAIPILIYFALKVITKGRS